MVSKATHILYDQTGEQLLEPLCEAFCTSICMEYFTILIYSCTNEIAARSNLMLILQI